MIFGRSRFVPTPELSSSAIERLHGFDTVTSPVPLRELDTFFITHEGMKFPVFCCFTVGKICKIRRMQEGEIDHNIRGFNL